LTRERIEASSDVASDRLDDGDHVNAQFAFDGAGRFVFVGIGEVLEARVGHVHQSLGHGGEEVGPF
jgi:hypothetical protein